MSPDPDYLYPSKVHQEALSYLRYGIEGHAGFVVITGEIGSGKTTMLQSLLGRLDRNTTVARIVNTILDARELLEAIMLDFGMDPTGLSKPVLLHRLADFLVQQRQANRLTLLVIDEAQNLSLAALEEIRMLSNLETEKSKLIQIVMIGQPELREKLALPQLEQLRQRITVSYHLQPLDADETANYINHRLKRAAIGPAPEFPRTVTDLIHVRSGGIPRMINVIADATLLFAYGVDRRDIDVEILREALAELDATGVLASYRRDAAVAAAATSVSVAEAQEAMRMADEMRKREQALSQRERQLAQREQAVAAQQRVVEEEARLLAAARNATAARAAAATAAPAAHDASGVAVHTGVPRTMVGPSHPANEAPAAPPRDATIAAPRDAAVAPASTIAPRPAAPPPSYRVSEASVAPASVSAPRPPSSSTPMPRASDRGFETPLVTPLVTPRRVAGGVWVQRYEEPAPAPSQGFWFKVRRALFGVTEPSA